MNSKITTDSQLSITEPENKNKNKNKLRKQVAGTEPQKWKSHGGLSVGMGREENGGNGIVDQKSNW